MKRKSDFAKHQLPKNFPHNDSQFDYVRKQMKRNYTTFKIPMQDYIDQMNLGMERNQWRFSQTIVSHLLTDIINNLEHDIEKIQKKRMVNSAILLSSSIANQLYHLQDPEKSFNQISPQPEQQPIKNITDPISGFNKQNFIKKPVLKHKFSHDTSSISIKEASQLPILGSSQQKKLPPLMKQLSEQKLQIFIPLDEEKDEIRKKSSIDFQELVRDRLLKEIQNRKFKQKIEALSAGIENNRSNSKKNTKSMHDSGQKILPKEDCNFDYDGNKIFIFSHGKVKQNLKILKALYKIPKQRAQQKPSKLQKKFHERISYVPRGSRNYLEINNKTISDFGDLNYSAALKEKLQIELRMTNVKFAEKQYFGKDKQKRDSVLA